MVLSPAVPELPVPDVAAAQAWYAERLGFEIGWHDEAGGIGAVSHGDCALFLRRSDAPARPATFWIFADDVAAAHRDMTARGADVLGPPERTPWGLVQFTVRDAWGNLFHVFHDP